MNCRNFSFEEGDCRHRGYGGNYDGRGGQQRYDRRRRGYDDRGCQGDASPKARGTCPAAAGEVRGTTTAAIWAVVGMIALAEGATGLVTGRASAALRGYQETKASASVATRGSRGLDADMLRNEVVVGTMAAGEGNRGTTIAEAGSWVLAPMAVVDRGHVAAGAVEAAECTCTSSSTKTCWRRQGRVSICVLLWERGCRTLMLSMLIQPIKACC